MTSKHLQQNLFNLTQYAEDSHAKTSVRQAEAKASRKKPDQVFFTNSSESYAWYDQSSSFWKTWQRSLITDWTLFSESFPKQGTMQNGQLFLQVHWEPVIVEADGGSLPTPIASKAVEQRVKFKQGGYSLRAALDQKMLPTPTAIDTKEDALKHATKLLQGKTHRSSGQPIQVSLSDAIMMEKIKENPKLMEIYQDHQMEERPHLPIQEDFVTYLRSQTTIKELAEKTKIKKTTIEHWFRKDKAGFSYPSIENWEEIKPYLKTILFDKEMTTTQTKEWTTKSPMLPTPTATNARQGVNSYNNKGKPLLGAALLPTPTATDHKGRSGQGFIDRHGKRRIPDVLTQTGDNMYLNPQFVEEMMGYEIGWTDLKH